MSALIFATNNAHKLEEIAAITKDRFRIVSLVEAGITCEIPETSETIAGNALQKARFIFDMTGADCFADDTGLEVDALGGAPGVYSARYAGPAATYEDNVVKLLHALEGCTNRSARFRTVIALILGGKSYLFEGLAEGSITVNRRGLAGFGYDPVFLPSGMTQTFAEMDASHKNKISHRGKATEKLTAFLLNGER